MSSRLIDLDTTDPVAVPEDVEVKADKVPSATEGHFAALDASGNITDSGSKSSDFVSGSTFEAHTSATNPHGVTKTDIGLGNVENMSIVEAVGEEATARQNADALRYTKDEVNGIINALKTGSREIVQSLPQSGEAMKIYMVPKSTSQANNSYDEYIWTASNDWEKIGDTEIDLSGYVRKDGTSVAIGLGTNASGDGSVAVGPKRAASGSGASATANTSIALGFWASASAFGAVQVGYGTNSVQNSFQFRSANLFVENQDGKSVNLGEGFPSASQSAPGAMSTADKVKIDNLKTVATTGSYNDLTDKPTIPAAQVNTDWNAQSGVAQILNKPTNVSSFNNDAGYITSDFPVKNDGGIAKAKVLTQQEYDDLQEKDQTTLYLIIES